MTSMVSATGQVTIERVTLGQGGADEATFRTVLNLLLELHTHVGMAPINPDKLARNCYAFLQEGMTFLARAESGETIGSLCLVWCDPYYSDWRFLQDKWFYVQPAYRSGGLGRAGVKLLLAARTEAIAHDTMALVGDTNRAHKRNREARIEPGYRELGFVSTGYVLALRRRGMSHGLVHDQDVVENNGSGLRQRRQRGLGC